MNINPAHLGLWIANTILEGGHLFGDESTFFSNSDIPQLLKTGFETVGLDVPYSLVGNYKKDKLNDLDVVFDEVDPPP